MSADANKVLFGITDIFFIARVESALRGVPGVNAVWALPGQSLEALYLEIRPRRVVLDLQDVALDPIGSAAKIRAAVDSSGAVCELLGFYPHVRMDIRRAAEEAGVHRIMPRSAFTKLLPEILAEFAVTPG